MRAFSISTEHNEEKYLHLSFNDLAGGEHYRVPLAKVAPQLVNEAPDEWPLVVKPIKLQLTNDLDSIMNGRESLASSSEKCFAQRDGWIYLFVNGYLWRELKFENQR